MMYFCFLFVASLEAFGGYGKFKLTYTFIFVKENDMEFLPFVQFQRIDYEGPYLRRFL